MVSAFPAAAQLGPCTIETVVGGGTGARGNGGPAVDAELFQPWDVRIGPDGLLYIADSGTGRIRRVTAEGVIETVAGIGGRVRSSGDGGPATQAALFVVTSMAFGPDGSLYFVERDSRVRRIVPDGIVTTIADGGAMGVGRPSEVAVAPDGSLYVTARRDHRIHRVTPDGQIAPFAGTGSRRMFVLDEGTPALENAISRPTDTTVAPDGTVYFVETTGMQVMRISPNGMLTTYLRWNVGDRSPDGTPRSEALVGEPRQIDVDSEGRLYWLDGPSVRRVGLDDTIETVWETETPVWDPETADDTVWFGFRLESEDSFLLFYEDRVYRLSGDSDQTLLAGVGPTASRGDGGPVEEAFLGYLLNIDLGLDGEVYIADRLLDRVRVARNGRIDTFAGTGESGPTEEGIPATEATIDGPRAVAVAPNGDVFIATLKVVYRVDSASGIITRYAGGGRFRPEVCCADGRLALDIELFRIEDLDTDSQGNLYILHDPHTFAGGDDWVSRISPDGVIKLLPGILPSNSTGGFVYPATAVTVDPNDAVIISTRYQNSWLWRLTEENGNFALIEGAFGFIEYVNALAADGNSDLYIMSRFNQLERLSSGDVLNKVVPAPTNDEFFGGDGGPAMDAVLGGSRSIVLDGQDNLYVADAFNRRIRRINSLSGCPVEVRPQVAGVVSAASFTSPVAPGMIVTIFGLRLGPEVGVSGRVENGRFTNELAGTRVWVDGRPAPITYSSAKQVNIIIPYATEVGAEYDETGTLIEHTRSPELRIEHNGVSSELFALTMAPASPALFRQTGPLAAAFNQDGTLNGPLNPAAPGTIIVVFGTGEGLTDPPGADGQITGDILPRPILEVSATIGRMPAEVLYFGAAPGLVAGAFQANIRIPAGLAFVGDVEINLRAGPFPRLSLPSRIIVGN